MSDTDDDYTQPMIVPTGWTTEPRVPVHLFHHLAAAQAELTNPPKDRTAVIGPGRSYDYSDLATVIDTVRPVLAKHGLSVTQWPSVVANWCYITTVLAWSDGKTGEWMSGTIGLPLADSKPQTLGSMQTYLRRYSLNALCGVAGEPDDDATVAQGLAATTTAKPPLPPASAPKPTSHTPRPITEAQAKFLKVELGKNNVTAKETVAWYNEHFTASVKTPLEFVMDRFDEVLRWVREGEPTAPEDDGTIDVDQQPDADLD